MSEWMHNLCIVLMLPMTVLPAGGLQLTGQGGEGLQTIAMTNAATAGGAIVHYAQGSDPQFIVPGKLGRFG